VRSGSGKRGGGESQIAVAKEPVASVGKKTCQRTCDKRIMLDRRRGRKTQKNRQDSRMKGKAQREKGFRQAGKKLGGWRNVRGKGGGGGGGRED